MLFHSVQFMALFAVTFAVYWQVVRWKAPRLLVLFVASFLFYAAWSPAPVVLFAWYALVNWIGGKLQAAPPGTSGSQTSVVQRSLSSQMTTGVLFGVLAATPGVLSRVSCARPPVYWTVAVMRPPTMSLSFTLYGMSELSMKSSAAVHPSAESVPPMHGMGVGGITWLTPSGVVRLNVPPENAQRSSLSTAF